MEKNKLTFGIELEFSCYDSSVWADFRDILTDLRLGSRWELTTDGSVNEYGSELRTKGGNSIQQILKDFKKIDERIKELRKMGKIWTDESGGFHIHLGIENWTVAQLNRFVKIFQMTQNDWYDFVTPYRRTGRAGREFCAPIRTTNLWSELESGDRYKALNCVAIKKHTTIELRLFESTLCYWTIKNTLEIVLAFAKRVLEMENLIPSDSHLWDLIENKKLKAFLIGKGKKLNPSHLAGINTDGTRTT